jgi:hypothetical protein
MLARCRLLACAGIFVVVTATSPAQTGDAALGDLGAALKPLLQSAVPAVLYEKQHDWDRQVSTPSGVEWHGVRPRVSRSPRNHGIWRKVRVTAQDLPHTLDLKLSDLRTVAPDRQTFKVFLAFQAGVDYEQQNWEHGLRLYSSSAEARLRLKLTLECESTFRVEDAGKFLPDFVFRLRIVKADLGYDNLVVEHIAGIGGSGARMIGEAIRSGIKQWKPSLERELLSRASAAIVKAADTREVRLGLDGLVRGQK